MCVYLREPLLGDEKGDEVIVVYLRNFGVRATAERVRSVIEQAVAAADLAGDIEWRESTWYAVSVESLDDTIAGRTLPLIDEGIWYMSGRIFFPEEPS